MGCDIGVGILGVDAGLYSRDPSDRRRFRRAGLGIRFYTGRDGRRPVMVLKSCKMLSIAGALALTLAACGGDSDLDTPPGSYPTHADEPGDVTTPNGSVDPDSEDPSNNSADATAKDIDLASDELPISAKDALETSADEVGAGGDATVHSIEIE